MLRMDQSLRQRQELRLHLTQKMQQAIHILQLSGMELDQYVEQELEANPVLEQVQSERAAEPPSETAPRAEGADAFDEAFDLDAFASQWDRRHTEGRDLSYNPDAFARQQYYQDSITQGESLSAHLMAQLRMAARDDREYKIGECIVGDIDDKGYFTGSLEAIAQDQHAPLEDVERVLLRIQEFEPTGVGARDVVECLLLQICVEYPDVPELMTLIAEHLEDLEHRQIPKIAKAMNITPERVEALKALVSKLNPWPGYEYTSELPQYVTPDVIVEKEDGEYAVYLSTDRTPALRIRDDYKQMAREKTTQDTEKKFLRDNLESAKWLIHNIEQRQRTVLRVAQAIVDVQKDFLDKGIEQIKPLTLQEIADKVGIHEATVSRTTRGKYMQTPQGLFELKFFFSPKLHSDSGDDQSNKSVQANIRKIIEDEAKAKPLSDQKIADILRKQGITIARRTVTKYRENQGILPAAMRKEY